MNDQRYELDELLGELRDGPVLLSDRPEVDSQRQRLLPYLRAHVRQAPALRRRERRIRRAIAGAGVSCAAVLGVFLVNHGGDATLQASKEVPQDGVLLTRGSKTTHEAAIRIAAQGELAVAEESALTTAQGVQVELGRATRVGLDALAGSNAHAKLRLVEGSVRCNVPPLGTVGTFSVVTADTEVVVHGTEFSVEVLDGDAPSTCVRVSEGKVEVRHGAGATFLGAGQFWGCKSSEEEVHDEGEVEVAEQDTPAENLVRRGGTSRQATDDTQQPPKAKPGTLAEETRLFQLALSAERSGDNARARRLYARLLDEYPQSPLAPDAQRGLTRVE